MRLLTETAVKSLFAADFEQEVITSAYSHINNLRDPLRCNIFALLIRELLRIAMERLVPDDNIYEASWFNGDTITRAHRYRFAITGTISDEQIRKYPELDTHEPVAQLVKLNGTLNKYAHLSPRTYGLDIAAATAFLREVEEVVVDYARIFDRAKKHIREIIWTIVQDSVNQHIMDAFPDELDQLSSNTRVEAIDVENLQDFDTSSLTPILTGEGTAEIELNYGSGDDGLTSGDSYPFKFAAQLDPVTFEVTIDSLKVDTSSFYE